MQAVLRSRIFSPPTHLMKFVFTSGLSKTFSINVTKISQLLQLTKTHLFGGIVTAAAAKFANSLSISKGLHLSNGFLTNSGTLTILKE